MSSTSAQQNQDPTALVSTFNALPRNQLSPSGSVPNDWHMSVRQVPLQPPGQVLFLICPAARYVHIEGPLPPSYTSATTEVKATIWSMLLLKAFNEGLGATEEEKRAGTIVGRPWSWVCNDAEMAGAVGEMLRSIGVLAPEGVGLAGDGENGIADEEWRRFFGKLHHMVRMR
ncbi:MAG: hypothetical protein ALECFALPRED_010202 [Alectoria fallacina]|uniref:Uncharacterized protein n=1 Tax=Alectoria fallacina TaxID=1903189 RepID=A0A8H3J924_9LECA|nr:MAG: hypothetical protein ALECFALPRED_010202 [Alectoria fallacina]